MRKSTLILGSVLAGLAVVGAALYFLIDVQQLRGPLQSELAERLHRSVELGPIGLRLFPLALRIDGVTIGEAPQFGSSTPFLQARQLYVSASLTALLQKRVEVSSLRFTEPEVSLIRNKASQWNAAALGGPATAGGGSTAFRLEELRIERGKVSVTDQSVDARPAVYAPIDLTLRDYAPGSRYRFDASLVLPAPTGGSLTLSGAGIPESGPSEGKLTFRAAPVSALRRLFGSPGGESPDWILDGEVTAVPSDNAVRASGQLSVRPGGKLQFQARYQRSDGLLQIEHIETVFGQSQVRASGLIRLNEAPARLAVDVQTQDAALPDLQRLAEGFGAGWQGETSGSLTFNGRLEGPANAPEWKGQGSIGELSYKSPTGVLRAKPVRLDNLVATSGGGGLRASGTIGIGELSYQQLVLTQVRADCRMDGGILRLDPLQALLFGGTHNGAFSLDTRTGRSSIALHSKLSGVDANKLLAATTSLKEVLSGKLAADTDLAAVPQPGQDFTRALNGKVNLNLTDGRIAGVQLLNELAGLARFAGFKASDKPYTDFVALTGAFQLKDGFAQTDNLRLDFDGGSLSAAGTVGLADQSLSLRLTSTLAKSWSQQSAGTQAAGWMDTFLANSKGEYVIPARLSGTLSHPKFAPDPERLARMKLEGFLPSSGATPQSVTDSVRGVMDLFRKKQQPPPK